MLPYGACDRFAVRPEAWLSVCSGGNIDMDERGTGPAHHSTPQHSRAPHSLHHTCHPWPRHTPIWEVYLKYCTVPVGTGGIRPAVPGDHLEPSGGGRSGWQRGVEGEVKSGDSAEPKLCEGGDWKPGRPGSSGRLRQTRQNRARNGNFQSLSVFTSFHASTVHIPQTCCIRNRWSVRATFGLRRVPVTLCCHKRAVVVSLLHLATVVTCEASVPWPGPPDIQLCDCEVTEVTEFGAVAVAPNRR